MPETIQTMGEAGADREIDAIWEAIRKLRTNTSSVDGQRSSLPPYTTLQDAVSLTVQEVDGNPFLDVTGLEFDQADGFQVTQDGELARIDRLAATSAPADVAAAAAAGASTEAANKDHAHKGVRSFAKNGAAALFGDVTLSEGANVTLTQVGNNIAIASVAGGGTTQDHLTREADVAENVNTTLGAQVISCTITNLVTIGFDPTNDGWVEYLVPIPNDVNAVPNMKIRIHFVQQGAEGSGGKNFYWQTKFRAFGTPGTVGTFSAETGAIVGSYNGPFTNTYSNYVDITPAGADNGGFAGGAMFLIHIRRNPADANDTSAINAYFTGFELTWDKA